MNRSEIHIDDTITILIDEKTTAASIDKAIRELSCFAFGLAMKENNNRPIMAGMKIGGTHACRRN